jgi:hypothetical protein
VPRIAIPVAIRIDTRVECVVDGYNCFREIRWEPCSTCNRVLESPSGRVVQRVNLNRECRWQPLDIPDFKNHRSD